MLTLPVGLAKEKAAAAKAQRLGDIVEQLEVYSHRKHKLDANFTEAPNKAEAMSNWLTQTWIPRQGDKDLLRELSAMVGMLDFVGFVYHGEKYWDRVEAIRKMKILQQ
jgi:hypothetical protein